MMVNTKMLVPMTDANRNFSKVVHTVDENGAAIILKNNQPRYVVVDFSQYDEIAAAMEARRKLLLSTADSLIEENKTAFEELAK